MYMREDWVVICHLCQIISFVRPSKMKVFNEVFPTPEANVIVTSIHPPVSVEFSLVPSPPLPFSILTSIMITGLT